MRFHIPVSMLFTAALSLSACSKKAETKVDNKSAEPAAKVAEAPTAPATPPATADDTALDKAAEARLEADSKCASGDRHDCDGDGVPFGEDKDDHNAAIGKTAVAAFTVQKGAKAKSYAEGCLMNLTPGWVVMVPSRSGAKTCDVDGEDDFALSLEFRVCPADDHGKACPLPQPGQTLDATLEVTGGKTSKTKVTVVRHEKPYVVLSVAPDAKGENGGEMRVLVDDTKTMVEASSWK